MEEPEDDKLALPREKLVMVTLRCTKEQRESLKEQAKLVGLSLNQYLLGCLFYYEGKKEFEEEVLKNLEKN